MSKYEVPYLQFLKLFPDDSFIIYTEKHLRCFQKQKKVKVGGGDTGHGAQNLISIIFHGLLSPFILKYIFNSLTHVFPLLGIL